MIDLARAFGDYADEYLQFDRITKPLHRRPDVCAFLLLDRLVPGTSDIVSAARHDEIWLAVEPDVLAKVATQEDILTLVRCGVRYLVNCDCLAMFV